MKSLLLYCFKRLPVLPPYQEVASASPPFPTRQTPGHCVPCPCGVPSPVRKWERSLEEPLQGA